MVIDAGASRRVGTAVGQLVDASAMMGGDEQYTLDPYVSCFDDAVRLVLADGYQAQMANAVGSMLVNSRSRSYNAGDHARCVVRVPHARGLGLRGMRVCAARAHPGVHVK